jgi:hypothetical protein
VVIDLAQQQGAGIGGEGAAREIGDDLTRAQIGEEDGVIGRGSGGFSV